MSSRARRQHGEGQPRPIPGRGHPAVPGGRRRRSRHRRGHCRRLRGHGEAEVIPPQACGGLAATVIIGALAGLLPAIRAARLSPTQALWTV